MVIQGDFVQVTLAVYGDASSEPSLDPVSYEATPLSDIFHHRLSSALDPANSNEPTLHSREIFKLIPHSPPLPVVIRLIFCLKPAGAEWGGDLFSLDDCIATDVSGLGWLEKAVEPLMTPVHDNVSLDSLKVFAEKTSEALIEKVRYLPAVMDTYIADGYT